MKKNIMLLWLLLSMLAFVGCESSRFAERKNLTTVPSEGTESNSIVVGFSQLGAESDWRSANTESMKEAFSAKNGYTLVFKDGQQKQSNQITAVRTFIQQDVDYIVLAPVTESGWDSVLEEAKEADIPVILVDRLVDVSDKTLYKCWVGSDFELEAKKVCEWLNQYAIANHRARNRMAQFPYRGLPLFRDPRRSLYSRSRIYGMVGNEQPGRVGRRCRRPCTWCYR